MSDVVFNTLFNSLEQAITHFSKNRKDNLAEGILQCLIKIKENASHVKTVAYEIRGNVHSYDIVPGLQANGYRSLLSLLECLLLTTIQLLNSVLVNCKNTFFRGNEYLHKLRLHSDVLHQLRGLLYYAQVLMNATSDGDLFVDETASEEIMHDCEILAKACFYGSLHGFQYAPSILPIVNGLTLFAAQYNDIHQPTGAWATMKSALNSSRYVVSPDLRGEKLEEVYNNSEIEFFKKFWSFGESALAQAVPSLVAPTTRMNMPIKIPNETFNLESSLYPDEGITVTFTSTVENKDFVSAHLISTNYLQGQKFEDKSFKKVKIFPKSKKLLFFCHGGGFVALTSKSYETLLREWAKELDCPILSIDYSLAPEAPFPQAFEECFYAYCWALKYAENLGTTAENVVFAGDSAGGNLILSVALRAGMYGIKMPNSIVTMYPACVVRFSASPARLMSVMDPLLPLGLLSNCLAAYPGTKSEKIKRTTSVSDEFNNNPKPLAPSQQPVSFQFLSNFVKDVGDGFNRMRDTPKPENKQETKAEDKKGDDDEFVHVDVGDANGNLLKQPDIKFKLKLPHNFQPLKSKFCGDNFRMHRSPIVKNPFLSPALADDDLIKTLPHVDIIACEFDPLLDDAVYFAKRLEKLQKSYQFHVVRGVPHGFLNYQLAREAREASKMCLGLIQNGLHLIKR